MTKKYQDLMFNHLMRTPSETHIFTSGESRAFELGFTACYEEMIKDLQALERKLKVATNSIDRFVVMNLPNKKHIAHLDDLIEALAEIKGE